MEEIDNISLGVKTQVLLAAHKVPHCLPPSPPCPHLLHSPPRSLSCSPTGLFHLSQTREAHSTARAFAPAILSPRMLFPPHPQRPTWFPPSLPLGLFSKVISSVSLLPPFPTYFFSLALVPKRLLCFSPLSGSLFLSPIRL